MRGSTTARLVLLAAIWGSSFLWIKQALRGLSPVEVTFARLILGAAVLFAIAAVRGQSLPRSPVMWAHIAVAAVFANAAPYLLFALGEQKVSSSAAGILNATTPLWTVVVALATRHERKLPLLRAGGLAVGFAGALQRRRNRRIHGHLLASRGRDHSRGCRPQREHHRAGAGRDSAHPGRGSPDPQARVSSPRELP